MSSVFWLFNRLIIPTNSKIFLNRTVVSLSKIDLYDFWATKKLNIIFHLILWWMINWYCFSQTCVFSDASNKPYLLRNYLCNRKVRFKWLLPRSLFLSNVVLCKCILTYVYMCTCVDINFFMKQTYERKFCF